MPDSQIQYIDSQTHVPGLAERINPRFKQYYSDFLFKYVTRKRRSGQPLTNIFKDDRDRLFVGIIHKDDQVFEGSFLKDVTCKGNNAVIMHLPPEVIANWVDITVEFWTTYIRGGSLAFPDYWWRKA